MELLVFQYKSTPYLRDITFQAVSSNSAINKMLDLICDATTKHAMQYKLWMLKPKRFVKVLKSRREVAKTNIYVICNFISSCTTNTFITVLVRFIKING